MARLKNKSLLSALQGSLGKEIVIKQYPVGPVVSKFPDMSKVKASPRQKVQRGRMREANAYAQALKRDPERLAAFAATLQPGESVYNKAVQAYLKGQIGHPCDGVGKECRQP